MDSDISVINIRQWRLSDSMLEELSDRSFPVQLPLEVASTLWRHDRDIPELGKILFALELSNGPSSRRYDDFKQSFRFPFLVEVTLPDRKIHLIWNLWDFRRSIEFHFLRVIERVEDVSKRSSVFVLLDEIAQSDLQYIVNFLIGWIKGYCNTACEYCQPTEPFYRVIRSNLVIYGFNDSSFFCHRYKDFELFEERVSEFKKLIPGRGKTSEDPLAVVEDAKAWIEQAKRETPWKFDATKRLKHRVINN